MREKTQCFWSKINLETFGTCLEGGRITRERRDGKTLAIVDDLPSGRDVEEWNCFPLPAKFPTYSQNTLLSSIYVNIYKIYVSVILLFKKSIANHTYQHDVHVFNIF